jgi:hypothetical protein
MLHGINFSSISEATTMYLIVHGIMHGLYWLLHSTERGAAIFAHYGQKHRAESVEDCRDGNCVVFAQ